MANVSKSAIPLTEVLTLLACPVCLGTLSVVEALVVCNSCRRRYPVRDGIPVLIAAEAGMNIEEHTKVSGNDRPAAT